MFWRVNSNASSDCPVTSHEDGPSALHKLGGLAIGAGILHHLLPFPLNKLVLALFSKIGVWFGGIFLLMLLGGAATTAVCAFTPLCSIKFFGFPKEGVRSLLTQDRIDSITNFVYKAMDKYEKMQSREGKAFVDRPENKGKKPKHPKENKSQEDVKENRQKEIKVNKEERKDESKDESKEERKEERKEEQKEASEGANVNREAKNLTEQEVKEVKEVKENNEVPKDYVNK